jgi:predicted anti-sigma-YlaC factor YlaD
MPESGRQFVDLELAGEAAESRLPQVRHHLDQCRVCREEYEILRDLARLEVEGKPPSIQDLKDSLG